MNGIACGRQRVRHSNALGAQNQILRRIQPCWLIDLASYRTDKEKHNETWDNTPARLKKELLLTMTILITPNINILAINSVNPMQIHGQPRIYCVCWSIGSRKSSGRFHQSDHFILPTIAFQCYTHQKHRPPKCKTLGLRVFKIRLIPKMMVSKNDFPKGLLYFWFHLGFRACYP